MEILLTNDDSHGSPLFHLAIEKLNSLGDLTIVVPKEEQSWTGKSITRFSPLHVDKIPLYDRQAFCVDGTPADCVNLAIYHLVESRPDVVVSGINVGVNTGISFALSSGTVGACLEANIAGVPAIAISQDLDQATFSHWAEHRAFRSEVIERLRAQSHELMDRVFKLLIESDEDLHRPITWNVNLPFHAAPDCRLTNALLGRTYYKSCFRKIRDHYQHGLDPLDADSATNADAVVVRQGHVSITRIDVHDIGQVST